MGDGGLTPWKSDRIVLPWIGWECSPPAHTLAMKDKPFVSSPAPALEMGLVRDQKTARLGPFALKVASPG